jgi:class 3 adenylate cyclase
MRFTIGFKIFSIALGLLMLMGAVAWLNLRMARTIDAQLLVIDANYLPAVNDLAQAHIDKLEESSTSRRLVAALLDADPTVPQDTDSLRKRLVDAGKASGGRLADAHRSINEQITDWLKFDDDVALARLDAHVEYLQEARRRYEVILTQWLAAAQNGQRSEAAQLQARLDEWRDDWDQQMDRARQEMRSIASNAILATRAYQQRNIEIGLALVVIAGLLGITVAAAVTSGLVRPVRRLLSGTVAVEKGALDTVVPVTSRDEIGGLTRAFNGMVGELRVKAQIRETFGKYLDPRIVTGLIDRPELTDAKGSRRDMTILFCDMRGFTSFSEGMTPVGLVNVLNRYLTVISEPVRRNGGIIDKYIGDAVMAYWGPPFSNSEEHGRLACIAATEQLAALPAFQAELPELTGIRRGHPTLAVRIGIATGEVVVGSIGSEHTRSYTVIGDTVNLASRLEGACKTYGVTILTNGRTQSLAGEAMEMRELDFVLVVGKTEPERIFEVFGRRGEVAAERLQLRDGFEAALTAYRGRAWDEAETGFRDCLAIAPDDQPSMLFLTRIAHFREQPPPIEWGGVWALASK